MYQFNLRTQTGQQANTADVYIDIDCRTQKIGAITTDDLAIYNAKKLVKISKDVSREMGLVYVPAQRNSVDAIQITDGQGRVMQSFNLSHRPDFNALCDQIKARLPVELTQTAGRVLPALQPATPRLS